jgi:hypothetical protein
MGYLIGVRADGKHEDREDRSITPRLATALCAVEWGDDPETQTLLNARVLVFSVSPNVQMRPLRNV